MNKRILTGAALVGLVALLIACGAGNDPTPSATPSATGPTFVTTIDDSPSPATSSAAPAPAPSIRQAITITDGIWQVPEDVKPGTYKTVVPADSWNCYWEVMRDFEGKIDSIMTNGNQDANKQVVMVIPKAAKGLEVSGCGTWTKIK